MKALKWIGIGLGVLIVLLGVVVGALHLTGSSRLGTAPPVAVQSLDIPSDEAALARGEHLVNAISGCSDCHNQNLDGKILINEAPIGLIPAPNLTSGRGGVGSSYTDEDWIRAMRHGVGSDGRTLAIMPSNAYAYMSDEDLGAMIAYLKSVPPADSEHPARSIMFPGTIIFGVLAYPELPYSLIDHNAAQSVAAPEVGVTAEYGAYLTDVGGCTECHGAKLAGRADENGPPPGPNLTPAGNLSNWSEEQFFTSLRTGKTPEGKSLDPELMPWPWSGNMTDEELRAIWLHLQALPARDLADNG